MRKSFCDAMFSLAARDQRTVFLTGDLGFMALEPIRDAMGNRFINAGVAEQNMVSMAAGMAAEGLSCWTYSIAPFLYARAFEQIRIDLAFHSMPVKLVGNGGGFGYGVQGPTHHAVEDYGTLLGLPSMRAYLPCTDGDVAAMVGRMHDNQSGPAYLRLGLDESCGVVGDYQPWRKVLSGKNGVAIGVGALAGAVAARLSSVETTRRPEYWICGELPLDRNPMPAPLLEAIKKTVARVFTVEEHIARSGLASEIALFLAAGKVAVPLSVFSATSQMITHYGSQSYMRKVAGIDPEEIVRVMVN